DWQTFEFPYELISRRAVTVTILIVASCCTAAFRGSRVVPDHGLFPFHLLFGCVGFPHIGGDLDLRRSVCAVVYIDLYFPGLITFDNFILHIIRVVIVR